LLKEGEIVMMWFIIATTLAFILGALGYYLFRAIREKRNLELKRTESQILIEAAKKEAGKIRVEGELQAKEIIERSKSEADRDYREKQKELSKIEKRLQSREENIDKKYESIERKETEISRREREALSKEKIVAEKEKELNSIITEAKKKIEEVAGMSQEAAKRELINIIENEAKHEAAKKLKLIEDELHEKAESKSKDIIALAIQKYAGQYTSEKTISVVNLPNDEMKGRIIGREGRYSGNGCHIFFKSNKKGGS
jgi:ribonuclease Y